MGVRYEHAPAPAGEQVRWLPCARSSTYSFRAAICGSSAGPACCSTSSAVTATGPTRHSDSAANRASSSSAPTPPKPCGNVPSRATSTRFIDSSNRGMASSPPFPRCPRHTRARKPSRATACHPQGRRPHGRRARSQPARLALREDVPHRERQDAALAHRSAAGAGAPASGTTARACTFPVGGRGAWPTAAPVVRSTRHPGSGSGPSARVRSSWSSQNASGASELDLTTRVLCAAAATLTATTTAATGQRGVHGRPTTGPSFERRRSIGR